ncbi:hypothetical protein [Streptomyces barkulensis]|uniref:hypothetical protein n=1 Tax=Streptomyces barkulensis TaxID=1257026 RepID=UPI000C6E761F|nr:hypothetical protein [Streptomyces barkulensis]
MSDYSGPYDGRQHDPSEMKAGTGRERNEAERERRPEGEERSARTGRERPGDEGEGEEAGEGDRSPGTGPAVAGPPPVPEG